VIVHWIVTRYLVILQHRSHYDTLTPLCDRLSGTVGWARATKAGAWFRFLAWSYTDLKNGIRVAYSLVLGVNGWALKQTGGATTDPPPVLYSLRKQPCCPRLKQAEMGAADHSRRSERSTVQTFSYKRNWIPLYAQGNWFLCCKTALKYKYNPQINANRIALTFFWYHSWN